MSTEDTTTTTTTTTEVETQTTPTVVKIKAEDCPVEVVTVFTNRAEVVRNVKTTFDAPGLFTTPSPSHLLYRTTAKQLTAQQDCTT